MPSLMEMPRKKPKNTTVQKRRGMFSKRMRFFFLLFLFKIYISFNDDCCLIRELRVHFVIICVLLYHTSSKLNYIGIKGGKSRSVDRQDWYISSLAIHTSYLLHIPSEKSKVSREICVDELFQSFCNGSLEDGMKDFHDEHETNTKDHQSNDQDDNTSCHVRKLSPFRK